MIKFKGFIPIASIILILAIIWIFRTYLAMTSRQKTLTNNNYLSGQMLSKFENVRLTKLNSKWGLYENLDHGFSFEFPWKDGVQLDKRKRTIEYPYKLSDGTIAFGSTGSIAVTYIDNSQKLNLTQIISKNYVGPRDNQNFLVGFNKYNVPNNGLEIYINRESMGADVNEDFFVMSPDNTYALNFVCFTKDEVVDHILSTLKFTK